VEPSQPATASRPPAGRPFPPPLDELAAEDFAVLAQHLEPAQFPAGACILKVNTPGDACYLIDQGTVRIDLDLWEGQRHAEVDSETALGFVQAGGLLGELSLLDGLPRAASAYAQTDVVARRLGAREVEALTRSHPRVAAALYAALGRDAALKLRRTNERLAGALSLGPPDPAVAATVARARAAQEAVAPWPEERIDRLLEAMARAVADRAEELAAASVAETGLGNVASKVLKDRACSLGVYSQLAGKVGRGPVADYPERAVTEIAAPAGVVFAVGPVTNPVSTLVFKALTCVKARNALIYSPNHRAARVTARVEDLLHEALRAHAAPPDLVQCLRARTSRKTTAEFMAHEGVALVLATGGPSIVRAAYSSGTPAIGVGAGNTPVLVCSDADAAAVVEAVVRSKTFDNGTTCGAEHNLVVVAAARAAFVAECEQHGAAVLSPDEADRLTRLAVRAGRLKFTIVGRPAAEIAGQAGITRGYPIRALVVPTEGATDDNPYAHEKLAPLLSLFTVADEEEGMRVCAQLLRVEGCGHTAVIHTGNPEWVRRFGELMPASRVLVNTPAVYGMLGLTTGLEISSTLGCGTFGGTSTTDNVTYRNVCNIKRLAHYLPAAAERWREYL
jgi:acyl-CoA reductase-like NAD-dependent aldehyde dehydrogenase